MRRGALLLVAVLAGALVPVAAPALSACAAEGPRAALVVDTGSTTHRYCVALPDDSVSGIDLIVLAAEQHGLTYRFGYGGNAVCMLADVGTTGDDCWAEYPDFWGYWRGTGDGWTWSSTGAHATTVTDGDVEGWSWGSGDGPSSHPSPPQTAFGSVCPVVSSGEAGGGRPDPDPGRHPKPQPPDAGAGPPPPPTDVGSSETTTGESDRGDGRVGARGERGNRGSGRRSEDSGTRRGGRQRPVATTRNGLEERRAMSNEPAAQPMSTRAEPGVPAGALLSIGLVGAFGVGGAVIARRRKAA